MSFESANSKLKTVFVSLWLFSLNGLRVNFDPGDVGPSTLTVAASRHEVRESDFIDSAQIRRVDPIANGHDPLRIQFPPTYFAHRHVALKPIDRRAFELVADQHGPIGKLHDRAHFVKAGCLRHHLDTR